MLGVLLLRNLNLDFICIAVLIFGRRIIDLMCSVCSFILSVCCIVGSRVS